MTIFEFTDYKKFVLHTIESNPELGRGSVKKIAESLRVHPSLISQILKGLKDFNPEQANDVATFLGLDEEATEYFLCLVEIERAGTAKLKTFLTNKRDRMIRLAKAVQDASDGDDFLKRKNVADRLYSYWYYSAIHLLSQIPKYQSVDAMAAYLKLPVPTIQEAVQVLSELGMIAVETGRVISGASSWADADQLHAKRFHMNWRLKAIDRLNIEGTHEDFVTLPVALSGADRERLREMILEFADKVRETADPAGADKLSVVTIDLFDMA